MSSAAEESVAIFHPSDVFIVVTGITGHGKSSFISKCCEGFEDTKKCNIYSFKHKDKTIRIVDTPGFDDSKRTGTEILRDIAEWLLWGHAQGVRLSGIVYLHSIQENRMKGSGITNLEMFKRITGIKNMNQVVLATTMWDVTRLEDAKRRELELWATPEFWGPLISEHKSMPARFLNDKTSALGIIDKIADLPPFIPSLQYEMAVDGLDLDQTSAGKTLNKELTEARERFAREMKEMEGQLEQALKDQDVKYAQQIMKIQQDLRQQMEQMAQSQRDMQVRSEELLRKKEEEIRKAREEMAEMMADQRLKDRKHEEYMSEMREKGKRRDEEHGREMREKERRVSQQHSSSSRRDYSRYDHDRYDDEPRQCRSKKHQGNGSYENSVQRDVVKAGAGAGVAVGVSVAAAAMAAACSIM